MMRSPASTVAQLALAVALLCGTQAAASPELARDKRCMNCHAIDRKVVGPSFRDVARRYAQQPDAAARMAQKIIQGGGGSWGPVPMAANPHVNPEEAQRLAVWLLGIK